MTRRTGTRYSESLEDEDYKDSRSNDDSRRYYSYDTEEQAYEDRSYLERRDRLVRRNAAGTGISPPPIRSTLWRKPARPRGSYTSDEGSGEGDEVIAAMDNELERDLLRRYQNNVDGHNRPGHSAASKLQRQGPRALSDVCNKDTISKDNTVGNEAQMDDLLARFGKRVLGMHCRELQKIPEPGPELDLASKWKPYAKVRY